MKPNYRYCSQKEKFWNKISFNLKEFARKEFKSIKKYFETCKKKKTGKESISFYSFSNLYTTFANLQDTSFTRGFGDMTTHCNSSMHQSCLFSPKLEVNSGAD